MSVLSNLFRSYKSEVFRQAIEYLENVSISGEAKKKIVLEVMKAVHVGEGGQWTPEIEAGVGYAIDFVLAEIRHLAVKYSATPAPLPTVPPAPSIYGVWNDGVLPTDAVLLEKGFKAGDVKYTLFSEQAAWLVTQPGAGLPTAGIKQGVIGG